MNTMFLCCLYVFLTPSLWIFSFVVCFVLLQLVFVFIFLFYLIYYYSFGTYLFYMKNRKGMDLDGRGKERELG